MAFNAYKSEPMSTKEIRKIANKFRNFFGISDTKYVPITKFLDLFVKLDPVYDYEIVEDNELPDSTQGETDVVNHIIKLKQSVYNGACDGNEVDRMSVAHEIAHYILICICGIRFARNFDTNSYVKTYQDPEWQAAVFASELLMPAHMIKGMTPDEISKTFGVTINAAETQLKHSK